MSADLTGRRLGHYQVDGVIGKGGMSVMYRATDVRLDRKVALKVIAEHLGGDPEFRARFAAEARNTSAIDHSHVVPLYDFGETDGLLYIAMRYVEGPDLASLIKEGPLVPPRAVHLLGQVADALDFVHGRGLVHLDVKPANVLVTKEAGSDHAYLADFGLTRRGATGHRTSSGDFLGSPTYAAPEHLRGEPVDPRTDQYALACVLFACLTGRAPFRGTVPEVIQGHLAGAVPAATSLVALPERFDEVVRRGMAMDPEERYGSCRELIANARGALSGPRTSVPPPPRRPSAAGPAGTGQPAAPSAARPPVGSAGSPPQHGPPGAGRPPPADGQPMRLRDPIPVRPASFADTGRSNRWVIPVVLAVTVLVLLILVVSLSG